MSFVDRRSFSNFSRRVVWLALTVTFTTISGAMSLSAQSPSGTTTGENHAITTTDRKGIVDSVNALLLRMYVFPDKAKLTADLLRKNLKAGTYDTFSMISTFTQKLTQDMQALTHDGHLFIEPADAPPVGTDTLATPEAKREARFEFGKTVNFGFQKVEILQWNIGYLNLKNFFQADVAAPTAIAAMNLLGNCRAVIIDIRENGGGEPSMIQLLSSYFFDDPVHLNNFFDRRTGDTSQFWTQQQVVGTRMARTPLYILTSRHSFSAAEEFAYNFKQLKRARIIGEATGGGAHPNDFVFFPNLRVTVSVAWGRAFNPISGTNWEGVGVEPDIKISADKALAVAQMIIIDSLQSQEKDSIERHLYSWTHQTLECDTLGYHLPPEKSSEYAGNFGPRHISVGGGQVLYQRDANPTVPLTPIAPDLFQHSESKYFRLKFVRDEKGKVIELVGLYPDGTTNSNKKED